MHSDCSFAVAAAGAAFFLLTSVAAAVPQDGVDGGEHAGETAGGPAPAAASGPTHADVIRSLNEETLARGETIYQSHCATCHGAGGVASLPAARSFGEEPLRYGADPYRMWQTLTEGRGRMPAQDWLTPRERYYAVQYVREALIRPERPASVPKVTESYLDSLSDVLLQEPTSEETLLARARQGLQEGGQAWAQRHPGDYGRAIYSQLAGRANAALTLELGDGIHLSYDLHRMAIAALWRGDLDLSGTKYRQYRGEGQPSVSGVSIFGLDRMRWSYRGRYHQLETLVSERTPFPTRWLDYHGHYRHGERIVLSYAIAGREVLEMPAAEMVGGRPVLSHTFRIGPGERWRRLQVAAIEGEETETIRGSEKAVVLATRFGDHLGRFAGARMDGDTSGVRWEVRGDGRLVLFVPPSERTRTVRVRRTSGRGRAEIDGFLEGLRSGSADGPTSEGGSDLPDLRRFTEGGDRVWDEMVTTAGQRDVGRPRYDPIHYGSEQPAAAENLVAIPEHYPYAVDRIGLPFENPWNSWIRPSGLDFLPDGRLVLSTYPGDVWLAEGIDEDLEEIRWQRIATGLYDPFGVKVVGGAIYVLCRDRIVRLRDQNGDGETDFYESFFADTDVSDVPVQAFNFGLQTDSEGHFLYAKAGQYTSDDEPGHLIEVAPDGSRQRSVAIGFRAPNGVTVAPDDRIFVSDNQGNWMPANKISLVEEGGFYGYVPTIATGAWAPGPKEYEMRADLAQYPAHGQVLPDSFDVPVVWMPQAFDNSPGGGVWTPEDWGPLGGRLLHTSFGKGWAYSVFTQEVDGRTQGAVAALPFQFDSGTQRARVNPADGQVYLAGLTGWDDAFAVRYGSLDRIRYTGGRGFLIEDVKVRSGGIALSFNRPLDASATADTARYRIEEWNYRWREGYGSAHYRPSRPNVEGHDPVPVETVALEDGGRTALLELGELHPVDQMRIELEVVSEEGLRLDRTLYLTIHRVP